MRSVLLLLISIALCFQASAQEMDKVIVLQDEVFFLQKELAQLKLALAEKDEAFKSTVIEKEALASKVNALQRSLLERDNDLPRLMQQAELAYRGQIDDVKGQLKAAALTLAQKSDQVAALENEKLSCQAKRDMIEGEKISLRQSLKKVADEAASLKAEMDRRIAEEVASSASRESDLKTRLSAEQSLVREKIALAKKPLEDQLKAQDAAWAKKSKDEKALLEDKVSKLEQQVVTLRESAAQEIKKAQAAAAADVLKVKDQLTECRSGKK